jgi:hypothetical protein
VDQQLSDLVVQLRNLATRATYLLTPLKVVAAGDIHAALVEVGYPDTANPANPNSQSDAQLAAYYVGLMNTLIGIYYGQVRQGGDGTANSATLYNFDQALSPLWGGQIS